ncbi:MAG: M24 family metallopeptidase, partial [Elusimicrobiota bacterium]
DGVYADITWCGFAGERAPERHEEIFQIVRRARDAALEKVRRAFAEGRPLRGRDVDRAARSVIEKAGYGKRFTHRTGHSMGAEDHANGANMDGYETREERRVLPGSLFSIEPGIYLPAFGARSEINVFVKGRRAEITGGRPQSRVIPILSANPAELR